MKYEQRAEILAYVAERKLSYAVIAELCGCTRNAVAGVVFRDRHPSATLVASPKSTTGKSHGNMTGKGWQPAGYRPEKTSWNTN